MKPYYLLIFLAGFILACSQNSGTDRSDKTSEKKIRKQITMVAEKYIMTQLTEPERTVSDNGQVTISDKQKKFIIEPSKIFTGLIDDDQKKDAIVSLVTFQGQYQTVSEQLIILKTEDDFKLASAIESDMRIISLKDRIITADVPEHSRSTPLFNCPSCWEVVKYQFKAGELVKVE
jgi:ABC-type Fe3+-hydroxamate transport system substrate-binding protein